MERDEGLADPARERDLRDGAVDGRRPGGVVVRRVRGAGAKISAAVRPAVEPGQAGSYEGSNSARKIFCVSPQYACSWYGQERGEQGDARGQAHGGPPVGRRKVKRRHIVRRVPSAGPWSRPHLGPPPYGACSGPGPRSRHPLRLTRLRGCTFPRSTRSARCTGDTLLTRRRSSSSSPIARSCGGSPSACSRTRERTSTRSSCAPGACCTTSGCTACTAPTGASTAGTTSGTGSWDTSSWRPKGCRRPCAGSARATRASD